MACANGWKRINLNSWTQNQGGENEMRDTKSEGFFENAERTKNKTERKKKKYSRDRSRTRA